MTELSQCNFYNHLNTAEKCAILMLTVPITRLTYGEADQDGFFLLNPPW